MKYKFDAEMEDGTTFNGTVDARDVRMWEALFKSSMAKQDYSFTMITQLAFLCLRRTGQLNGRYPTYEHFDKECIELRSTSDVDGDLVADPTQSAPTDGSSAISPSA